MRLSSQVAFFLFIPFFWVQSLLLARIYFQNCKSKLINKGKGKIERDGERERERDTERERQTVRERERERERDTETEKERERKKEREREGEFVSVRFLQYLPEYINFTYLITL